MSLENNLKSIGLEEKEAQVYLATLELGPTNIQNLAKKAGIKRSTVYEILRNLKNQGLISEAMQGKRKLIIASSPDKLKRNIKEKHNLLNLILPELKSLHNAGPITPKITYYEGREGLREIYMIALEAKNKRADWVSPIQSVVETVGEDFLEKYVETKKRMGYWIRSLHITSRQVSTYKYLDPITFKKTLRDVRFSPQDIDIPNTIAMWDNKVAIISTQKEGFGFIIESKDFSISMKMFYELLWNISKPYGDMNFENKNKNEENKSSTINKVLGKDDDLDYWAKQ